MLANHSSGHPLRSQLAMENVATTWKAEKRRLTQKLKKPSREKKHISPGGKEKPRFWLRMTWGLIRKSSRPWNQIGKNRIKNQPIPWKNLTLSRFPLQKKRHPESLTNTAWNFTILTRIRCLFHLLPLPQRLKKNIRKIAWKWSLPSGKLT